MKLKEYIAQSKEPIVSFVMNGTIYNTKNKFATWRYRNVKVVREMEYNGHVYAQLHYEQKGAYMPF